MSSALDELRASFRDRLAERVGEIEAAWEAVVRGTAATDGSPEPLRLLLRLAHSLYGAAGTFGYPEAGEAAREIERRARELLARPGILGSGNAGDLATLAPLVAALRRAL